MRIFLAILLAMAAFVAAAQKATVDRVELTNSIAASKYPRYDLNGRTAAIVIVQVIDDNVEFKGSVLEVVKQTGEYWVYMGVGAKELHIHSGKFVPVEIRFPEYGIPRLEAATTYAVTLQLPAAAAAPAQSAAAGHTYLLLRVEPADAKVTVDGAVRETRNGNMRVLLRKNATYDYLVEAPGYIPEQGRIAIGADKVERTVALRSSLGSLTVSAVTPGTEIYLDGTKVGSDTWQGQLEPGEYTVEGRRTNYTTASTRVSVATGETATVTLPALSNTKGLLQVTTATAGTEIYLNGEKTATDSYQGDVAPGDYLVEGRLANHRSAEQLVNVTAGHTASVAIPTLLAITGSLNVDYEPEGAVITIDGQAAGTAPDVIDNIIVGEHSVHIASRGYLATTRRVNIAEGKLATLSGALTKAPVYGTTTPTHLSLCAVDESGNTVYITRQEWKKLKPAEKATLTPRGVCIVDGTDAFAVALHNAADGASMTKDMLVGYCLPTKDQAEKIVDLYKNLDIALIAFDGEPLKLKTEIFSKYWTKGSYVIHISKKKAYLFGRDSYPRRVREVCLLNDISVSKKPFHLALCVSNKNGSILYFSTKEWTDMSPQRRNDYIPEGVCWKNYLVDLKDESYKNWHVANNRIPSTFTIEDVAALNDALLLLGGEAIDGDYWTDTETDTDSTSAYCLHISFSNNSNKRELKNKLELLKSRPFRPL